MLENLTVSQVVTPQDQADMAELMCMDDFDVFSIERDPNVALGTVIHYVRLGMFMGLARHKTDPVGYSIAQVTGNTLYSNNIFTREDVRRQGVGKALKQAQIDHAKAHGLKEICTTVSSDNIASLRLQESMGFKMKRSFFCDTYKASLRLK